MCPGDRLARCQMFVTTGTDGGLDTVPRAALTVDTSLN